jgi:hypothetical protein
MRHIVLMVGAALAFAGVASAQNKKVNPDEAAGVQNRRGDASPGGGFSTGEANSRIDDYFNQDEQINVNPDSGVVKVLRVNQKNLINDFVTAVFPLNSVLPREVRNVFRTVCAKEGGRAEVIQDKVQKKYWLQVICPAFMLPHIEEAVRQLDQAWIKEVARRFGHGRVPREVPADRDVRRHRVRSTPAKARRSSTRTATGCCDATNRSASRSTSPRARNSTSRRPRRT